MKTQYTFYFLLVLLLIVSGFTHAQKYTLNGYVKDKSNGEVLIGANIYIKDAYTGTSSNAYGFYSITLPEGDYEMVYDYIGYETALKEITLNTDISLNVELELTTEQIEEVMVSSERKDQNIVSNQMSNIKLQSKTIEKIPVLMGEVDMIKSLQLLPGVKSTGEASSGMSIRGGARDQNLMLLDEATVYNASHLGGIFSVFNNDAIKNVELYKGNIPAQYGGRLSSLIDIRMKDGDMKKFSGRGGIGLISSRLTLEAPIVKDKGSFIVSGRRTYLDAIISAARKITGNEKIIEFPLHFYDLNAKANYTINQDNRVFLSGYFGRDVFAFSTNPQNNAGFNWGNYTGTIRWNHIFNRKLFSNYTFLVSNYDYLFDNKLSIGREEKEFSFEYDALVKDYALKADFGYYLNDHNTLTFGISSIYHDFKVGEVKGKQDTVPFNFKLPTIEGIESAVYLSNKQKFGNKLTLTYGLRYSMFQNIGEATVNKVDDDYNVTGTIRYDKGEIYHTTHGAEPRLGITYVISGNQSVKASYMITRQYLLIASNSRTGNPLDVWICVNPNIKPQIGYQYSGGYFRNFLDNNIETSFELYYRDLRNQVVFKEFAQPQFNPDLEEELRFGKGRAYGMELLVKKPSGKLNGWISYTWSRSERNIKDIQQKGWYLSPYDSPHDFTIVAIYEASKRIDISGNWVFRTGRPLTAPSLRYEYGNLILPWYAGRNEDRMPDYHRLDLGLTIRNKEKPGRKWEGEWVFSVYNAYARKNADAIYFDDTDENPLKTAAYRTTYFSIFPAVTYNFRF